MAFPQNISLVLGDLGPLIEAEIEQTGETPSEFIRAAIAKKLKVKPPTIREGNPNASAETAKRANAARWGK